MRPSSGGSSRISKRFLPASALPAISMATPDSGIAAGYGPGKQEWPARCGIFRGVRGAAGNRRLRRNVVRFRGSADVGARQSRRARIGTMARCYELAPTLRLGGRLISLGLVIRIRLLSFTVVGFSFPQQPSANPRRADLSWVQHLPRVRVPAVAVAARFACHHPVSHWAFAPAFERLRSRRNW